MTPATPKVLCLWHASCMDGFAASAILHNFFDGAVECRYIRYNDPIPLEDMRDKHVYLVDFSMSAEVLMRNIDSFASLTIIDHHSDAMQTWVAIGHASVEAEKLTVIFDNEKSGAMLTWNFFHPNVEAPNLIKHLQDYDLWVKEMPRTDEIQSGLRYFYPPKDGAYRDFFLQLVGNNNGLDIVLADIIQIGSVILEKEQQLMQAMAHRHHWVDEYSGAVVCPMPPELVNIAGEYLYTKYPAAPFVAMFEDNYKTNQRKWSFRSRKDGGADVSAIAATVGGKGHYNAAGAIVDLLALPFAVPLA